MATFVLTHGAFTGGWCWEDVAEHLRRAGHRVEVVEQLPSAGTHPAVLGDLQADAAVLREVVEAAEDRVVLVGHSYGGMVITELADHPAVAHSVYVSGLWPRRGQSGWDLLADAPAATWLVSRDNGTLEITDDVEVARQALCADVELERVRELARRQVPQSVSSGTSPSTAPDRRHPTTYILLENDRAIPPALQEKMAADADHVVRLPSSHQAMFSMPEELAVILGRVG